MELIITGRLTISRKLRWSSSEKMTKMIPWIERITHRMTLSKSCLNLSRSAAVTNKTVINLINHMNSAVLQSLAFPWSRRTTTTAPSWTIPRRIICINLTHLTHFKLPFIIPTPQLKISTRTSHITSNSRFAENLISLRTLSIPTRLEGHFETMLLFALFF